MADNKVERRGTGRKEEEDIEEGEAKVKLAEMRNGGLMRSKE